MTNTRRGMLDFLRELQTMLPLSGFYEKEGETLWTPPRIINQIHINADLSDPAEVGLAKFIEEKIASYSYPEKALHEVRLKKKTHWNLVLEGLPEEQAQQVLAVVQRFEKRKHDDAPCILMCVPQISPTAFVLIQGVKPYDRGYQVRATGEVTHCAPIPEDVNKYAQTILLELLSVSQNKYAEHVRITVESIRAIKQRAEL